MIYLRHYDLRQFWVWGAIIGYVIAEACWLSVVYLQIRCRNIASTAASAQLPLPAKYFRLFYTWCLLGIPASLALIFVIYLMAEKPVLSHA